jgi:hypothetical protein
MREHRPIVAALHIVLACPHQFDWDARHALGDGGCFARDVRIEGRASAEAAARVFGVECDLFRLQSQNLADGDLIQRLRLRRNPGLGAVAIKSDGGVQRLHRRMSEIGKRELGNDPIRRQNRIDGSIVAALDGDLSGDESQGLVLSPQPRTISALEP